jgi:hypothetical protein
MDKIIAWLASTRASAFITDNAWVIPAVQVVHILAICVVMSSVLLLNLRLIGVIGGGEPKDVFTRRYLPWVWVALCILLLSGSTLIVGEPNRDLEDWVFWTKMSLLLTVIVLTLILEQPVRRNAQFWDTGFKRPLSRTLAVLAISCWVGIVLCGRWIAYTYGG